MKWREDVPLTERDYREIRANVMHEVRSPVAGRRSPVLRFAYALIAAIVVIALLWPHPDRRLQPAGSPTSVGVTAPVADSRLKPAVRPAEAGGPVRLVAHRHRHHKRHAPAVLTATRIDIQTADPDVRIIWFAR